MVIAKVKIAPVERWCLQAKSDSNLSLAGRDIEIVPARMVRGNHFDGTPARAWPLSEDCEKEICLFIDRPDWIGKNVVVCEHMLELD